MRAGVLMFACLACAASGGRVRRTESSDMQSAGKAGVPVSFKSLALLLLAYDQASGLQLPARYGAAGMRAPSRHGNVKMATEASTGNPSQAIKAMANGMTLLKPVFGIEANIQASVLGSDVDEDAVSNEIAAEIKSSPVVIYTYGLSPFSSEALALLDATGCKYRKIELGGEWFQLDGKGSVKRVLLSKFADNGATSLPKIFVNGECIGGFAELAESVSTGRFIELTKPEVKSPFDQLSESLSESLNGLFK